MKTADYFFIVGCPRSGTTLLSVMLDRHSRLCIPPETAFFCEIAPRLAHDKAGSLPDILGGWSRLNDLKLHPETVLRRLGSRRLTPGDVLAAILDLYAQAKDKPRCGEKTPQHLPCVPAIIQCFPDSKILCLLRDGRDVALSLNAMPWWHPRDLADAAKLWKQYRHLVDSFTLQYPERFRVVVYEDLVAHPREELTSIMHFLWEEFEPGQLLPEVGSDVVLPRSVDWKGQALGPVDGAHVGRRRALTTAEENVLLEKALFDERDEGLWRSDKLTRHAQLN